MNKHLYMAVMFSIILGLYIPKDMQFTATIMVISSIATYIGIHHQEYFTKEGDDDDERTDSNVQE